MVLAYLFEKQILRVIGIGVLLFLASGCLSNSDSRVSSGAPPNIVIILVDDMGYGDVEAYSADSQISTPHIDQLAAQGMRFTNAHAPGALCHPSRYGLLTGRYPYRTNVNVWPRQPVIDHDRLTIASLLKKQGYQTAMVGKWHLGFDESEAIQTTQALASRRGTDVPAAYRQYDQGQQLSGGPVDRGFDSFFGIRASTDIPPYFYIRGDSVVHPPTDSIDANYSEGWSEIQGAFWRAGGIAPNMELANVLPRFTEEANHIIRDHHDSDSRQPLMLYMALPSPHTPWLANEQFEGQSGAGMYGDFMMMVDEKVGEILATLKRERMAENTLVVFTSDNGPVWYPNDIEEFGHDAKGGLRGMKGDAYEAGHRMPFIVRWPGVVQPGSVSDQPISFTDLMATFADITGTNLPDDAGEDSFSLLPVLTGDQPEGKQIRPPVVSVSARGVRSIQDGTWKFINGLGSGGFTKPAHIEPSPGGPQGQLYNLQEDPGETINLWNDHPEKVKYMSKLLEKWDHAGTSK